MQPVRKRGTPSKPAGLTQSCPCQQRRSYRPRLQQIVKQDQRSSQPVSPKVALAKAAAAAHFSRHALAARARQLLAITQRHLFVGAGIRRGRIHGWASLGAGEWGCSAVGGMGAVQLLRRAGPAVGAAARGAGQAAEGCSGRMAHVLPRAAAWTAVWAASGQ